MYVGRLSQTTIRNVSKIFCCKCNQNSTDKSCNCILLSGRLTCGYFEYVNTLFSTLLSVDTKNQQTMLLNDIVIMPL